MSRSDPIRASYFDVVQTVEACAVGLFYTNVALSFGVLIVEQSNWPILSRAMQVLFAASVVTLTLLGLVLRLYLTPRAEDMRRQDFFGKAWGMSFGQHETDGYYNNDAAIPIRRAAAQLLENSLFSKEISQRLARRERCLFGAYVVAWFAVLHWQQTPFNWMMIATQILFSEHILSRWMRVEWLKGRFEQTFKDTYDLIQSKPSERYFEAKTVLLISNYESAKSVAGVCLPSKIFENINEHLSREWDLLRSRLGV